MPSFRYCYLPIFVAVCIASQPGCKDSKSQREAVVLDGSPRVDLDRAYSIQDYKTAIPLLEKELEANPNDGRNWFRLGYALHSENRLEEAIDAHKRAAELDESQKPTALYNWACALALLGEREEALERLEIAVAAGFDRWKTIVDDPDLVSINDEPGFRTILESLQSQDQEETVTSPHSEFDFWVGNWDLEDTSGQKVGRTNVVLEQDGFALTETWRFEGSRRGTTLTFFDPREKVWKQTLVSNNGRVDYLTGTFEDGTVLLSGEFITMDQRSAFRKVKMTPNNSEQTVGYHVSESADGENWKVVFEGRWVVRKPKLSF